MKEYALNPLLTINGQSQLISKYIKDLDTDISSAVNFLDFVNGNYIVLNKEYKALQKHFIPFEGLKTLGVLEVGEDNKTITRINLQKMWLHSIIINNFGQDGDIDIYYGNNKIDTLREGFAVVAEGEANGEPVYSIVSLDSSGSYYILSNTVSEESKTSFIWDYYPNAIDEIGSQYVFAVVPKGVRFIFNGTNFTLQNINSSLELATTYAYNKQDNGDTSVFLSTLIGTYWTNNNTLGYNIYNVELKDNKVSSTEEIYCDDYLNTKTAVIKAQSISVAELHTNMNNCHGLNFFVNFY